MRMRNHAPQSPVLKARMRLTAGLAISASNCHDTPDQ
jgi:hypothetical protein